MLLSWFNLFPVTKPVSQRNTVCNKRPLVSKIKPLSFQNKLLEGASYILDINRPGRFSGVAGNAGNHGNDGKFHKSHKVLTKFKTTLINYVWEKSHVKKQ